MHAQEESYESYDSNNSKESDISNYVEETQQDNKGKPYLVIKRLKEYEGEEDCVEDVKIIKQFDKCKLRVDIERYKYGYMAYVILLFEKESFDHSKIRQNIRLMRRWIKNNKIYSHVDENSLFYGTHDVDLESPPFFHSVKIASCSEMKIIDQSLKAYEIDVEEQFILSDQWDLVYFFSGEEDFSNSDSDDERDKQRDYEIFKFNLWLDSLENYNTS